MDFNNETLERIDEPVYEFYDLDNLQVEARSHDDRLIEKRRMTQQEINEANIPYRQHYGVRAKEL